MNIPAKDIEFLNAAAAVYAWVCAADGTVTPWEIKGFVEYLSELDYVNEISCSDFRNTYLSILEAFETNFMDGISRAQSRIEAFKNDPEKSLDLLRVAHRILTEGDSYNAAEKTALKEIAKLLSIDLYEVECEDFLGTH